MLKKIVLWLVLVIIIIFVVKAFLNHYHKTHPQNVSQAQTVPTLADNQQNLVKQVQSPDQAVNTDKLTTNETAALSAPQPSNSDS